mmetsp:Transcript_12461/g.31839  ORF Transcript_12461/g.31839 Transcript_12461/m.31839 type:complete len:306 (-) Transcript_12461:1605-2522(-)
MPVSYLPPGGGGGGGRMWRAKYSLPPQKTTQMPQRHSARPASTPTTMAATLPGVTKFPSASLASFWSHSREEDECSVRATARAEGSERPPALLARTRTAIGVPAFKPSIVHMQLGGTHDVMQLVGSQEFPPSSEYCTRYDDARIDSWSRPQYCLPSVPMVGDGVPSGLTRPGGFHVTMTLPSDADGPGTDHVVTLRGGGGRLWGVLATSTLPFCARLEKLLLRELMYLYDPGFIWSNPRSTVGFAWFSFWQFVFCWSLFTLPVVAQLVCLTRANCLVSSSMPRAPEKVPSASPELSSIATSNMLA